MQIIAQREGGEFLLIADDAGELGRVWDRGRNALYPEQEAAAILKFGYWTDYRGSEDPDALVRNAEELTPV